MSSFFPQSTFFGLDMMATSLQSFSVAENVTSDNISNVNTPGASRQQVDLNEQVPLVGSPFMSTHVYGTAGQGAIISQIQRIHSDAYDAMFRGASSSQNFYSTQQNALQGVQAQLGDPNSGVGAQYAAFQSAYAQLVSQGASGNPTAARATVLNSAQALATALGTSSAAITSQEAQTLQAGSSLVTKVNGVLDQIAALNGQIRASTAVGDNPNTYSDQRDYLIDQLSQYLSTQTSIQSDGSTLVTVNGQALVNDVQVYHLASPVIGVASNGAPTFKIDFATSPPAAATAVGVPLGSGQLAALQDLYNNKLVPYGQQLDQFASGMANEVNRITQSGYDQNAQPGTALFQPIVASLPITAGNIKCGITNPSQLPMALANTNANTNPLTGVVPMNSANNTVDTSAQLVGNTAISNPPAVTGSGNDVLNVTVNGVTTVFKYDMAAGGNSDTVDNFVNNFNAAHSGVIASFDAASQRIVFARDEQNESLALRGTQQNAPMTPDFTVQDVPSGGDSSLLTTFGAANINNINQNATNAFAASDNGAANSMMSMFQLNVGIPALETKSGALVTGTAGTAMTVALPAGINNFQVGQVLTLDAQANGASPQENVTISAVSYAGGIESVTFTPAVNHAANFTITSAPVQTLQQYYGQFISQVGLDTQTAITGTSTQTSLSQNINNVRQGIAGINIDEETQNLVKYQNAYQAAAKTISTLNSLLGTIINGLGVGQ